MADMVDIKVIIDENYIDPLVNIYTKSKTDQIDNIIYAIENNVKFFFFFYDSFCIAGSASLCAAGFGAKRKGG